MAEVFFASVLVFIVFVCHAIVDAFCMGVMQPMAMHSVGGNVGRSRGRRPLVRALFPRVKLCGVVWSSVEFCGVLWS